MNLAKIFGLSLTSRFLFAGIGLSIVMLLPLLFGSDAAAKYFTLMMAISLFSGWFSLSYRQQLYVDMERFYEGKVEPLTLKKHIIHKIVLIFVLMTSVVIAANLIPIVTTNLVPFILILASYFVLTTSYVKYWYNGKLYFSYAFEGLIPIVMLITFIMLSDVNLLVGSIIASLFAFIIFYGTAINIWRELPPSPNSISSHILGQLISISSFAEVMLFAHIDASTDIVNYRITLSFLSVISILMSVMRQWDIFRGNVVKKRSRSIYLVISVPLLIALGFLSYLTTPNMLYVLLILAVFLQLIAASDQFIVIKNNMSKFLIIGYLSSLVISFGSTYLFNVSDLYGLLLFKIILVCTATIVPPCTILISILRNNS